jgi:RNA polymerase sigma-70 factor (ECF subfamily)
MAIDKLERKSSDDIKLMRAIARGNMSELGQLYLRHRDRTVALAYRILGQWNRAEDISQEAFLRVYMAAGTYRPDAKFTTWLYKIVVNLCIDEKRQAQRSDSLAQTYEYLQAGTKNSLNDNEREEIIGIVHKAIQKLNRRQRTVVILHKLEGLSHAEISNRTGWSQSSIESLLVRAYRKLRKELFNIPKL